MPIHTLHAATISTANAPNLNAHVFPLICFPVNVARLPVPTNLLIKHLIAAKTLTTTKKIKNKKNKNNPQPLLSGG